MREKIPESELLKVLPKEQRERQFLWQELMQQQATFLSPWLDQMTQLKTGFEHNFLWSTVSIDVDACKTWLGQKLGHDWMTVTTAVSALSCAYFYHLCQDGIGNEVYVSRLQTSVVCWEMRCEFGM